jgi:hypothetical protein
MFRQPYRGQPSKKPPKSRKTRRTLTPKEKARNNIINTVVILLVLTIFSFIGFLVSRISSDQAWMLVLFVLGIFLLIFFLNTWTNKVNKYLRADDLDEPKKTENKQDE